jgi:tRNA nucleotidyltransferase (CCA-adding enzyme)
MHIILTHEQADFDALASLLGAYLLDDAALPVLPRRMNRNVRAFLSLYGVDLPFIEARDLPSELVEAVTLVDTQAMVSIKGMSSTTRVRVLDHHPLREGLPTSWTVTTDEIGATTTLLIEALREQNGLFSTIQATLLLLGIYEDTGSLTYTRTTSRDLQAAAYLLEQGANLQIANSFLNHPLSQAQQALYDRLRATVEYHPIHGYTIVLACGEAQEMEEELSSIAHKLRDLLDPDALFLLVTTRNGVQMIARSTNDNIDVAAVVANFGGGGHERAAASLIRGRDLEEVHAELVHILPGYVRPAITVAQIMSLRPQLLSPDTPVEEAAQRMSRYGYEGYPVVLNGKIVGLLTRRAVDRAISHKLNTTAGMLMEAGGYTVSPDDSVEHLQRLVTETGWGQVPVVDPASGEVIGIVTRTDLLKTFTARAKFPGRLNLAERLEAALPADRLALLKIIADAAVEQRVALYIVGGFVRDLLLERPSLDFDLVVEGDAIALARLLARQYGGRVTSHSRFGTAKWHLEQGHTNSQDRKPRKRFSDWGLAFPPISGLPSVDLVSARTEFYTHPSALPTVERGSIKLDLHRRDFTINTLALRLDGRHYGELHDYWGGLEDLRSGLVRVLHSLSFVDDPTRILRAARFEQRFEFRIEDRTMELLLEARPLIERLSGDRLRHELYHILDTPVAAQILRRLNGLGLLAAIHPDLAVEEWLYTQIAALANVDPDPVWDLGAIKDPQGFKRELSFILWLIRLPPARARPVIGRLRLPASLAEIILAACGLWMKTSYQANASPRRTNFSSQAALMDRSPSAIVSLLEDAPPLAVYALYLATSDLELKEALRMYFAHWRKVAPLTNGDALKARGIPPGPFYRRILGALRDAWLDGQVSTAEQEQALLEELLREA